MVKEQTQAEDDLIALVRVIVSGDDAELTRRLARTPELARRPSSVGAARGGSVSYFFEEIQHYLYAGDTPLHVAAAAHSALMVRELLGKEADPSAANRRGATPLHYAADMNAPNRAKDAEVADVVELLLQAGAEPNARDKSGVGPLHRAVRTRNAGGVGALLIGGRRRAVKIKVARPRSISRCKIPDAVALEHSTPCAVSEKSSSYCSNTELRRSMPTTAAKRCWRR